MATSDWLLAVTLFTAPIAEWAFQQAYDAITSRSRRLWWMVHYQECVTAYLDRVTSEREFEAESAEFERFHQNCKALTASWKCREFRMAA